jgi:hypothetical protein
MTEPQIEVWEITPHQSEAYDVCIIPESRDPEGRHAIDYAKDALEAKWDTCDDINAMDVTVRVRRMKMNLEDLPEGVEP